jgi:hypothetical protein
LFSRATKVPLLRKVQYLTAQQVPGPPKVGRVELVGDKGQIEAKVPCCSSCFSPSVAGDGRGRVLVLPEEERGP